ncbi:MAG: RNA methyltransferase [Synechococcales cyanobacterium M58_A2018_015]|nr:RNA methyltransferase [Synechococcales cyanobacterium M58_A2018_015]
MTTRLAHIRIILVEPAGPLNVGSVARVMKNMGLEQLVLVNPQCDPASDPARHMAVHAADVLLAARQVPTLPDALQGCQRAIATTGLDRTTLAVTLEPPRSALPWLLSSGTEPPPAAALIFGREDHGLTKSELNYAQRFVRIPTSAEYPSLNLAQAVAICCYELALAAAATEQVPAENLSPAENDDLALPDVPEARAHELAPLEALEQYYQQLEALLLQIGYLYPHTARSRMEKLRRLYSRAELTSTEVAMLRGMVRQINWALQTSQPDNRIEG